MTRILNDLNTYVTVGVIAGLYFYSDPSREFGWWVDLVQFVEDMVVVRFQIPIPPAVNLEALVFVLIGQVILEAGFWFLVINLSVFEKLGWLEKYRLQNVPINDLIRQQKENDLTKEAIQGVLLSHWVIRPVILYFAWQFAFEPRAGPLKMPIPSLRVLIPQIFCCMMIDDTWFYWFHRLFHAIPYLYKTVHKQHHKFTRPNVFATEFAHPIEDIWVNSIGTIVGPLILGGHPFLFIMYPAMKIYQSMEAHSGFNIPFPFSFASVIDSMDCAPAHDFHHSHNVGNFGGWTMLWDWLCRTDTKYENYVMVKQRDNPVFATARRPYVHDGR